MEAAAAACGATPHPLDVVAASVAFAALSRRPLESRGSELASLVTSGLGAQKDAAVLTELLDGSPATGAWLRRLELVCRRERLHLHLNSLGRCFSPLHKELHVIVSGAAAVSATCGAATQQLRQALAQRQPALRALQLLRDRQLLLQERQRLCGLLLEQLRLSSPLLQVITAEAEAAGGEDAGDNTASGKGEFCVCERFFDALEELQRIHEHATQLQRVAAPPALACAAATLGKKDEMPESIWTSAASSSVHSSSLRRRALAEALLQQTGELQELAYERLYLWLQQECRAAAVAPSAAEEAPSARLASLDTPGAALSQFTNSSPLRWCTLSKENQCATDVSYKHDSRRRDSSSAPAAAESAAAKRIACFFTALGAAGVAASLGVSLRFVPSRTDAESGTAAREGPGAAVPAERGKALSFSEAEFSGSEATAPAPREEFLRRQGDGAAEATGWQQKAYLWRALRVQGPLPLLLRAFVVLQDRPAYLYHCLQELLQARRKSLAEEFYRLLSAPRSSLPCKKWLYSSCDPAAAALKRDRDGEGNDPDDGGAGCRFPSGSTRLLCLKRCHPLIFLQGLLQCATAVAARERAVVIGLQQLLQPVAARCEADTAAASEAAGATEEGNAVAAQSAEQRARQPAAETSGGLQLTDDVNVVEDLLAKRDLRQNDAAIDTFGVSEVDVFARDTQKEEGAATHWETAAESDCDVLRRPPDATTPSADAGLPGDGMQRGDSNAVEMMCSEDILERLLGGVAQLFEQQMEEVFAAVQQQASGGPADGGRQQQRPAYTLAALAMAHLLDRQAVFLRRVLLFSSGSGSLVASDDQQQQQRRAATNVNETAILAAGLGETETAVLRAVVAPGVQHANTHKCSDALLSFPEAKSSAGAYGKIVKHCLPSLITCCETYAEKAELLFLSLWEQQVVTTASSSGGAAAYSFSSLVCDGIATTRCSNSGDPHVHNRVGGGLRFSPTLTTLFAAPTDREGSDEDPPRVLACADAGAPGGKLLEVTACLREALEILHAPLSGGHEEREATSALGCFIGAAAQEYYCHAAGYQCEGLLRGKEISEESSTVGEGRSRAQGNTAALPLSNRAGGDTVADGEVAAMPLWESLMETIVRLFEPPVAVCRSAPGRRSKTTGLRITDRLRPLQEGESEELDSWVESSVAPLLNFCRQETRRFSDAGDAAVFLINAYACIETPLRRFGVCQVYSHLLEELIEQQFTLLHQIETNALLSRVGLRETLDAVRREVQRRKTVGSQATAAAGQGCDKKGAENGVLVHDARDGKYGDSVSQQVQNMQLWESRLDTWDTNDDVQVGGALSPGEPCLQGEALSSLFRKFSLVLHSLRSVELQYTGRLILEKHRLEARRSVLRDVVTSYTEVYVHTKHLGFAVHTPGEVALLVAA